MNNTCSSILIVQSDLQRIVNFSQKCLEAGVDESSLYATVYVEDILGLLSTKNISTIIVDADFYNLETASILKYFSEEKNLRVLLVTSNQFRKTIRMIMDKNLKYINPNISACDLNLVLNPTLCPLASKVVHL